MVTCNLGFKIEGSWQFECRNGKLQDKTGNDRLPTCVPIKIGRTIKYYDYVILEIAYTKSKNLQFLS